MYKKIVFSLAALGCLSIVSFAQDFYDNPAALSVESDSALTYAINEGNRKVAADLVYREGEPKDLVTLVSGQISDAEQAVMQKSCDRYGYATITFYAKFKDEKIERAKAELGIFYKYGGYCKILMDRSDWETAYDEVMPGWGY